VRRTLHARTRAESGDSVCKAATDCSVVVTRHVLAIHAHPDDVEILAGGTLALLAGAGHRITIVSMTPGDCGSAEMSSDEIAAIRRKEAAAAAARIDAVYRCAEFRDLAIYSDDPSRRRVVELLRQINPDVVLTSSPIDYMCDHEATSALVRDACFAAPARNFATSDANAAPPIPKIPHLYFMDPIGGEDRDQTPVAPDFFVDISSSFETKKKMLAEHASQRQWLLKHHGMDDYIETMERWTREMGRRAGVEFAEGFRRYKGHPYPQEELLGEMLRGYALLPHLQHHLP
jgi:LmbE family N-acetylglucosaminyl deacetylase